MRKNILILFLILAFVLSLPLIYSSNINVAHGEYKVAWYNRYDVDIIVNSDSSLSINETMVIKYVEGDFTYGFRNIPYYGFDDIVDIHVYELVNGSWLEYAPGSDSPGKFSISKDISGIFIKWWYNRVIVEKTPIYKVFRLTYRATVAVDVDEGKGINYLHWYCLPNEHLYIEESHVNIYLPDSIQLDDLKVHPDPVGISVQNGWINVSYVLYSLRKDETLEVYLEFPKIINPPFSLRKTINRYFALLVIISIITPIIMLIAYKSRRDERYKGVKVPYGVTVEPPKEIDQTELHVLNFLRGTPILPIVTLFQLAEKKLIKFIQGDGKSVIVTVTNEDTDTSLNLSKWEEKSLELISRHNYADLKTLAKRMISKALPEKIYNDVIDSLIGKKLIPDHPSNMGLRETFMTLVFLVIPITLIILAFNLLLAALLGVGLIQLAMVIISAIFVKHVSVHRTVKGERELLMAKAYVNYLRDKLMRIGDINYTTDELVRVLDTVVSNNFSWLIAIDGLKAFRSLRKLSKLIIRIWGKHTSVLYWYPFWISFPPPIRGTSGELGGLATTQDLARTLSNISTIFTRSISGFIRVGGFRAFGGASAGAGGGGAAGVG